MILVHVQHFLNKQGKNYFPIWLEKTEQILSSFEGFIRLKRAILIDKPYECHLILEFQDITSLNKWSKSIEHLEHMNRLKQYSIYKHESEIYEL
ncbi:MAG: hypothetical protein ACTSPG_03055 [Candidatus Hodarchaeales archaeon]